VFFLGANVLTVAGRADQIGDDHSLSAYRRDLISPAGGIIPAIVIPIAASLAALALTQPLARSYESGLAPRTGLGASIGARLDRLHVMRANRSLCWSHHVRQAAIVRLGKTGARLARLDPILHVVNITFVVAAIVTVTVVGAE
jgi:hypothetical protein